MFSLALVMLEKNIHNVPRGIALRFRHNCSSDEKLLIPLRRKFIMTEIMRMHKILMLMTSVRVKIQLTL